MAEFAVIFFWRAFVKLKWKKKKKKKRICIDQFRWERNIVEKSNWSSYLSIWNKKQICFASYMTKRIVSERKSFPPSESASVLLVCLQTVSFLSGEGRVWQRCRVSCVTRASNWYWLTVGQGLLSLQQVWVEGECLISSTLSFIFLFLSCPSLSSPQLSRLSLFSLSLGDDTKWPTRVDVSLNPNTISQSFLSFSLFFSKIYNLVQLIMIW